jgi:hypothetical protein
MGKGTYIEKNLTKDIHLINYSVTFLKRSEWENELLSDKTRGLMSYMDESKTNEGNGAGSMNVAKKAQLQPWAKHHSIQAEVYLTNACGVKNINRGCENRPFILYQTVKLQSKNLTITKWTLSCSGNANSP